MEEVKDQENGSKQVVKMEKRDFNGSSRITINAAITGENMS